MKREKKNRGVNKVLSGAPGEKAAHHLKTAGSQTTWGGRRKIESDGGK